jgi:hypothetical protein
MDSHTRGYPTLLSLNGSPVGALVLAKNAVAGDIWLTDGCRAPLAVTVIVDDAMTVMTDGHHRRPALNGLLPEAYARQALLFGAAGQDRLRRVRVVSDRFGIGWRPELAAEILAHLDELDVLEVLAEDCLRGAPSLTDGVRELARVRQV